MAKTQPSSTLCVQDALHVHDSDSTRGQGRKDPPGHSQKYVAKDQNSSRRIANQYHKLADQEGTLMLRAFVHTMIGSKHPVSWSQVSSSARIGIPVSNIELMCC